MTISSDMTVKAYAFELAGRHGWSVLESPDVAHGAMVLDPHARSITIGRDAEDHTLRMNATEPLFDPNIKSEGVSQ